jgi:hypothetical protein
VGGAAPRPGKPALLLTRGRRDEAEAIMAEIEAHAVSHELPRVARRLTV